LEWFWAVLVRLGPASPGYFVGKRKRKVPAIVFSEVVTYLHRRAHKRKIEWR
jgi:hypothetical protein